MEGEGEERIREGQGMERERKRGAFQLSFSYESITGLPVA